MEVSGGREPMEIVSRVLIEDRSLELPERQVGTELASSAS
jgi:hypothetical protein